MKNYLKKIFLLRVFHGVITLYFTFCLFYLYYTAFSQDFNPIFWIAIISLGIEGFIVFILNKGECPLIHVQRRIDDNKSFFELFFPRKIAKLSIPVFSIFTIICPNLNSN